eukprot:gene76-1536_t
MTATSVGPAALRVVWSSAAQRCGLVGADGDCPAAAHREWRLLCAWRGLTPDGSEQDPVLWE